MDSLISSEYGNDGLQELISMIVIGTILGIMYNVFTNKKLGFPSKKNGIFGLVAIVFVGIDIFSLCLYSFQLFRSDTLFLFHCAAHSKGFCISRWSAGEKGLRDCLDISADSFGAIILW